MLIRRYRLYAPRDIQCDVYDEEICNNQVLVRPLMWSLCKADLRYYFGERDPKILKQKLPLGLIHEAVGEIVFDPINKDNIGKKVILIPNQSFDNNNYSNYSRQSKFYSSSLDGFMRELIPIDVENTLDITKLSTKSSQLEVLCMSELISVSLHALRRVNIALDGQINDHNYKIGVWGDGVVGFLTALVIKKYLPKSELVLFGKHNDNMMRFSFVDRMVNVSEDCNELHSFDFCFECVGGVGASNAINQIIDLAKPCSKIALLGVSEEIVGVNTRMILEKGLELIGCSRSERIDFILVKEFLEKFPNTFSIIGSMITNRVDFNSINDINEAFRLDKSTRWGKTIIKV